MTNQAIAEANARIMAAAADGRWWDDAELAKRAKRWLERNPAAREISRSHWHGVAEIARGQKSYAEFAADLAEYLDNRGRRDRSLLEWGRPGLKESFIRELELAVEPSSDDAFQGLLDHMNETAGGGAQESGVRDQRRLRCVRAFLEMLLKGALGDCGKTGGNIK